MPLQPVFASTDESRENIQGGWGHMIKYCENHEKIENALLSLDFLIIQIDSDICHEFGVDQTGQETTEQLANNISKRLIKVIGNELYEKYHCKIIFAVCVQMIECWLLPLHESQKSKRAKTAGCIETLNKAIKSKGFYIDPKNKELEYYRKLADPFCKQKVLVANYAHNPSLKLFYAQLIDKISVK